MTLLPLRAPVSPLTVGVLVGLTVVGLLGLVVVVGLFGLPVSTQNIIHVNICMSLNSSIYCICVFSRYQYHSLQVISFNTCVCMCACVFYFFPVCVWYVLLLPRWNKGRDSLYPRGYANQILLCGVTCNGFWLCPPIKIPLHIEQLAGFSGFTKNPFIQWLIQKYYHLYLLVVVDVLVVGLVGQVLVLQVRWLVATPSQPVPPSEGGGLSHTRRLVCSPPPHVTEQAE